MKLYNTLTRTKETLILKNNRVTLYVCGITPYDTTHLGHAFTYVSFDSLVRYLRSQGIEVIYTQNVTDIDDPLFERARKVGQNWQRLGQMWTQRYLADMKLLGVEPPTYYPKVTQEIPTIITIIKGIQAKGLTYQNGGNLYFDTSKDKDYGKLSTLTYDQMIALCKERGNDPSDPRKKNPLDFILWQTSKSDEPSWKSPWGEGRPGWHIECTAMSVKYLGPQITLHGGGKDLIFPHHESEIAQSEAYSDKKPFVHLWMHTGVVGYEGVKMSKSLGNLVLVNDLVKIYSPLSIRWYLLSHHYRADWEFNENELKKAQLTIDTLMQIMQDSPNNTRETARLERFKERFTTALEDDFNTPEALNVIEDLTKKSVSKSSQALLMQLTQILGLFLTESS